MLRTPQHSQMKRLILCFDGTWETRPLNRPRRRQHYATNVEKTHIAVAKKDNEVPSNLQVTWYRRGIGSRGARIWPGLTGHGISEAICDAYAFISDNFEASDHLYIFGFSRGAYTARSLCHFLEWVGILAKPNLQQLPDLFREYRRNPQQPPSLDGEPLQRVRVGDNTSYPVRFLGVWDTVGSIGFPVRSVSRLLPARVARFHRVELTNNISHAYQALAIHERRIQFRPEIWTKSFPGQVVEQAWFAGCHADIGGGNKTRGLSDVAWLWMLCQAELLGLALDRSYIGSQALPSPKARITNSSKGMMWAVPRRIRVFGSGVNECCHPSVTTHVTHFQARRRRRAWKKADQRALALTPCVSCCPSALGVPSPPGLSVPASGITQASPTSPTSNAAGTPRSPADVAAENRQRLKTFKRIRLRDK
jgi:hypothetical protein